MRPTLSHITKNRQAKELPSIIQGPNSLAYKKIPGLSRTLNSYIYLHTMF